MTFFLFGETRGHSSVGRRLLEPVRGGSPSVVILGWVMCGVTTAGGLSRMVDEAGDRKPGVCSQLEACEQTRQEGSSGTSFFLEYLDRKSWKLVPAEISLSSEA